MVRYELFPLQKIFHNKHSFCKSKWIIFFFPKIRYTHFWIGLLISELVSLPEIQDFFGAYIIYKSNNYYVITAIVIIFVPCHTPFLVLLRIRLMVVFFCTSLQKIHHILKIKYKLLQNTKNNVVRQHVYMYFKFDICL